MEPRGRQRILEVLNVNLYSIIKENQLKLITLIKPTKRQAKGVYSHGIVKLRGSDSPSSPAKGGPGVIPRVVNIGDKVSVSAVSPILFRYRSQYRR